MTEPTVLRVLLVDDHPVVRAGLRAMLTDTGGIQVVAEAVDGESAVSTMQERAGSDEGIDVVLMDLQLGPGIDGIAATRRLKQILPELPVLVLTTYDAEADILAAVEAGASGYMLKDAPPEQIHQAVQDAAAGRTALAPQVAATLMDRVRSPAPSLSGREVELLELLATGASNREMARQLFISEATVKTHLVHIYQKLGVDNRVSAIAEARRRRILRD
ncbi:response regulator transcription factor [Garicola koreensis]|uniref:response regulator transcription factor n=1 Tax=Garicola koreensis TaxID=1262554 RepID=UPI0031E5FC31